MTVVNFDVAGLGRRSSPRASEAERAKAAERMPFGLGRVVDLEAEIILQPAPAEVERYGDSLSAGGRTGLGGTIGGVE